MAPLAPLATPMLAFTLQLYCLKAAGHILGMHSTLD